MAMSARERFQVAFNRLVSASGCAVESWAGLEVKIIARQVQDIGYQFIRFRETGDGVFTCEAMPLLHPDADSWLGLAVGDAFTVKGRKPLLVQVAMVGPFGVVVSRK